ncbi:MAG: T9SS type A sorting domain-containing protein [Bacteroidota bacterium]
MKIIGIILLLITSTCQVFPQTGFVFRYSTNQDEIPNDIIETNDGGFIISASIGSYPLTYQSLLIRLNRFGDTIKTKKINQEQGICYLNDLIKLDNGTYMGIGEKKTENNSTRIWLLILSDSLSIIKDTSFSTELKFLGNMVYCFMDHFHEIIVYGCADPNSGPPGPFPYIFKFSQSCDSLFFHYYTNPWGQYVFSMMEKHNNSGYLMSLFGSYNGQMYSPSQFLTMDYLFNVTQVDSVPGKLDFYLNTKTNIGTEFYATGKRHFYNSNPRTDKIGILKLDTNFHIRSEFFLGPDDTVSYPAYNTNIDFINEQNIYLGGVVNQDWGGIFSYNQSFIVLGKLDSSLSLTWQKYYGGDMYYMVWSVIATTDGGCIIGATSNDYAIQGENRDIYILKVDSNGLITGISDPPDSDLKRNLVYPNPGNEILNIETSLKQSTLSLYDLSGRLVSTTELHVGRNSINTQSINPGLYIFKISENSVITACGKWIKSSK